MTAPSPPPMISPAILGAAASHAPLAGSNACGCSGSSSEAAHILAWSIIGVLAFVGWAMFPMTVQGIGKFTKEDHMTTAGVVAWYVVPVIAGLTWLLTR